MMQSIYLLDTNIVSEITKHLPNQNVLKRIQETKNISSIATVAFEEMLYGVKRIPASKKQSDLFSFYVDFIQANYEIIPFDLHASWIHSDIRERLEQKGKRAPLADSMIAATAIANNLVLVTRNVKDFEDIKEVSSLMIENWFEE
ncbi:MAG: type II toxin-antitoxin system VapC family toxin [Treponema sp.]|nr:type II toxin-antitoxin system VapC family toxin [Treponema sp.]